LQIYKWQLTSVLSILHRMTGIALSLGLVVLALWVTSAVFFPSVFEIVQTVMTSWLGKLALVGWSWAAFYHLSNGVRHLVWDMGRGYQLKHVYASGWAVVIVSFSATAGSWWYASCPAKPACWTQSCPTHCCTSPQAPGIAGPVSADLPETVLPEIPEGGRP
jgi:succinate dehydrogenase / fumarate reductase cytochrome b subunit